MIKKFPAQKTAASRYSSRFIQHFIIKLPVEKINLCTWISSMTDADYCSYSVAHKAMTATMRDEVFCMKNVENIGIETLVQYYELKYHAANHVQLYSANSKAFMLRWFPVTVGVPWELYVESISADRSRLTCLIGTDYPNLLVKIGAWFSGAGGLFLRKHLQQEGEAFASDIEIKFKST